MENKSFRELIVKEYVHNRKPEKKSDDVWGINEYIKFYEDNKKSLSSLLLDINEYFVDNNKIAINTINKNLIGINDGIVLKKDCFEALDYFKNNNITFDVILLDPPYHDNLMNKVLNKIYEYDLLNKDGIVVCEYEEGNILCSYEMAKEKKYGNKKINIYKK